MQRDRWPRFHCFSLRSEKTVLVPGTSETPANGRVFRERRVMNELQMDAIVALASLLSLVFVVVLPEQSEFESRQRRVVFARTASQTNRSAIVGAPTAHGRSLKVRARRYKNNPSRLAARRWREGGRF